MCDDAVLGDCGRERIGRWLLPADYLWKTKPNTKKPSRKYGSHPSSRNQVSAGNPPDDQVDEYLAKDDEICNSVPHDIEEFSVMQLFKGLV